MVVGFRFFVPHLVDDGRRDGVEGEAGGREGTRVYHPNKESGEEPLGLKLSRNYIYVCIEIDIFCAVLVRLIGLG